MCCMSSLLLSAARKKATQNAVKKMSNAVMPNHWMPSTD